MSFLHNLVHMVRPGRTTAVPDETGTIGKIQVRHSAFETRLVNFMQQVGFASALPVGSDVAAMNVAGDNSNGVVVASNHQTHRPKNLLPGETMIYDCGAPQQSIKLAQDGSVTLTGFHNVRISCDTQVTIVAPTTLIEGDLRVTGKVTGGYGGGDAVGLQSHTHTQGSDSRGDSESATNSPTAGT